MAPSAVQWLLFTSILSLSAAVVSVVLSWRAVSRSTALRKWARSLVLTQTSDARVAALQAEVTELFSTLQKVLTNQRKLTSRYGMADMRAEQSAGGRRGGPPPPGASKAELRAYYIDGKSPRQIHQLHSVDSQDTGTED